MNDVKDNSADLELGAAFLAQSREFLAQEYLPKIQKCLESLSDRDLWWRPNEESNSIGNLLLHLSGNARQWIVSGLGGSIDRRERQTEFDQRAPVSREDLLSRLRETLHEVDAVLAEFNSSRLLDHYRIQECDVTALAAIYHVVEHFSMHTGQIILLTKLLANKDLGFYDFSTGSPAYTWNEPE
ncbi:MAG: hypothetical protein JWM21_56 [Acidobacteria bacterium]|nr:hypothetical protein [Acidobacteriota bacterium]